MPILAIVSPEAQDVAAFPNSGKLKNWVVSGLGEIVPGATQTPVGVLCHITQLTVVLQTVSCRLIFVLYSLYSLLTSMLSA